MTCRYWLALIAWLNFIELDKMWFTWLDWLVFCDWGFSLSALWCPLSARTILVGFLLPCTWGYLLLATPAPAQPLLTTMSEYYQVLSLSSHLSAGIPCVFWCCEKKKNSIERSSWPRQSQWCDHSPRARHPGMWSQVGLRKHHYEQS